MAVADVGDSISADFLVKTCEDPKMLKVFSVSISGDFSAKVFVLGTEQQQSHGRQQKPDPRQATKRWSLRRRSLRCKLDGNRPTDRVF